MIRFIGVGYGKLSAADPISIREVLRWKVRYIGYSTYFETSCSRDGRVHNLHLGVF